MPCSMWVVNTEEICNNLININMATKILLNYKADKEYEVINETGAKVDIDMYGPDEKKAQSPMELVLSGVIACAAVDIVSIVKKKRKTFIDLKGEALGERRNEIPRKFVGMEIKYTLYSPDTSVEEFDKIVALAVEKYCSVISSLDPNIEVTHNSEVITQ